MNQKNFGTILIRGEDEFLKLTEGQELVYHMFQELNIGSGRDYTEV